MNKRTVKLLRAGAALEGMALSKETKRQYNAVPRGIRALLKAEIVKGIAAAQGAKRLAQSALRR